MRHPIRTILDGHLDLAMNALQYERDQTLTAAEIRAREAGVEDDRGTATTSIASMRAAGVVACVSTLIARTKPVAPSRRPLRSELDHPTREMAHAAAMAQLAYYRILERKGHVTILADGASLERHWESGRRPGAPLGIILTMEGADPITEPSELEVWHRLGLRTLMLAHFGPSPYAMGTLPPDGSFNDAPLTPAGREILVEMERLAMPLDLTHLCDRSFFEGLERFGGRVYASHSNCRALADTPRQLTDEQLRRIFERDGVVGIALHCGMLRGRGSRRADVGLDAIADHVLHVCELAGSARHVALGSDLDGGFGVELTPDGIDTVADLAAVGEVLRERGLGNADVDGFLHGNWLRFWRAALP